MTESELQQRLDELGIGKSAYSLEGGNGVDLRPAGPVFPCKDA